MTSQSTLILTEYVRPNGDKKEKVIFLRTPVARRADHIAKFHNLMWACEQINSSEAVVFLSHDGYEYDLDVERCTPGGIAFAVEKICDRFSDDKIKHMIDLHNLDEEGEPVF